MNTTAYSDSRDHVSRPRYCQWSLQSSHFAESDYARWLRNEIPLKSLADAPRHSPSRALHNVQLRITRSHLPTELRTLKCPDQHWDRRPVCPTDAPETRLGQRHHVGLGKYHTTTNSAWRATPFLTVDCPSHAVHLSAAALPMTDHKSRLRRPIRAVVSPPMRHGTTEHDASPTTSRAQPQHSWIS